MLKKQIVGNINSTVAEFINKLDNSDWIKLGLKFIPQEISNENGICPFCQEKTISKELIDKIKDFFDESYEKDLQQLKDFLNDYIEHISKIPNKTYFETNPKIETLKKDFELNYNDLSRILNDNKKLIEDKIKSPSLPITLKSTNKALEELTSIINSVNNLTEEHNSKIDNKEKALYEIKKTFWDIMRYEYDQTLSSFITEKAKSQININRITNSIEEYTKEITNQRNIIVEQHKQTINIEEAIININNGLLDLGIEGFKIKNHTNNLYKIIRDNYESKIFHSLSEGEKMIISFLYFIELCRGTKDIKDAGKKKIIVIDDPISSLSHVYVFNVGRFIHNEFLRNESYEQVFLLTHSLYFFYEMTDPNHERRKTMQKLFRLVKNTEGSQILNLNYEEIQNDYHSYWFIIKDEKQPPALIANCMRNIIEYFFNFVEKRDLNNVFLKPELQNNRFQAFIRYMNRESHSLGQNIFDFKEYNYLDFKEAFALVFKESGYEDHYKKMIKE